MNPLLQYLLRSFLLLILSLSASANLGHRLGGDIYQPENTLYSFRLALKNLAHQPSFHYAELDIIESMDGVPIVFHDLNRISRIVPKTAVNLAVLRRPLATKKFKHLTIADLTAAEIQNLNLKNGAKIPTLKQVLDEAVKAGLKKKILIEVKSLRSDACRNQVINLAAQYRKKLNLNFLAFKRNYQASFPDQVRWTYQMKLHQFKVFTCCKPKIELFNQAVSTHPQQAKLEFTTLVDQPLSFQNEQTRTIRLPLQFIKQKGVTYALRIGIHHGNDNTGDRGLKFEARTKQGTLLFSGFSKDKRWEWFHLQNLNSNDLVISLTDKDTKFSGRFPGNMARVKVTLVKR